MAARTPALAGDGVAANGGRSGSISRGLLNALRFARENSQDPGFVFSPDEALLVGFGPNLYRADDTTTTLFADGKQIFRSVITENVNETVPALAPGVGGTVTVTAVDSVGGKIKADILVTSINDPSPDFLVTGETTSSIYTGAYFAIKITVQTSKGSFTLKTVLNVLNGTFPFEFGIDTGTLSAEKFDSLFDLNAISLLALALQIIQTDVGMTNFLVPTDLLQDFSLRKFFRHLVKVVAIVIGVSIVGIPVALALSTQTGRQLALQIAEGLILGILIGVLGNYTYDRMKNAGMLPGVQPQCPPGTTEGTAGTCVPINQ
jgi:hypothetical protein